MDLHGGEGDGGSASWMAYEVWVRAPGLMTMASASVRQAWMWSMIAPSWFDWKVATSTSSPRPHSTAHASSWASVSEP